MDKSEKIANYYTKERPFKNEIAQLRAIVKTTQLIEDYKWSFPVYTLNNKNVIGICAFKKHFGIWFFNGSFLTDPKKVLENAQEGKTQAMRHWKFHNAEAIDKKSILIYIEEAIANQKKGLTLTRTKAKRKTEYQMPTILKTVLDQNSELQLAFNKLTPYKQREYFEYLETAKQEKTKISRLSKIEPMILNGIGLNDKYR